MSDDSPPAARRLIFGMFHEVWEARGKRNFSDAEIQAMIDCHLLYDRQFPSITRKDLTPKPETDTRDAMTFDDIKATANLLRHKISNIGDDVKALKDNAGTTAVNTAETLIDKGEVIANIQLAFRHLEDARMRLGKSIQAIDGGKSIYDTEPSRPLESNL